MPGMETDQSLAQRVSLRGKTALVTGASRGIGEAVARRLDASGVRVALSARSEEGLKAVAATLSNDPVVLPADLALPHTAGTLAASAIAELGSVDVLVNNAGVFAGGGPTSQLSSADADALLGLNVRAALQLAGRIGEHMAGRGGGSIINLASVVATTAPPYTALYTASKGALEAATRALAGEWGAAGVRVNAVSPGIVDTDMGAFVTTDPDAHARYNSNVPLGRVASPDDVADLVAFLASPAASYINASNVLLDGGWATTSAA
jgi:NAD(P)-dependent dehydrogenase (short-subunit alcohol dehydrogenase family)